MSAGEDDLNFGWLVEREIAGCAGPASQEDLDSLKLEGINAIVRLGHPNTDYVMPASQIAHAGLHDLHLPVPDFQRPSDQQIEQALRFIDQALRSGAPVAVSCGAGCGRTGTILACHLIARGYAAKAALQFLIEKRPCSAEILERTPEQEKAIYEFERRFKSGEVTL